jgi:D-alanyl-D-alanine carboxypeptidase
MAKITAYALKNPDFARIVATKSYRIAGEGKAYPRSLTNHNKLLSMYDSCIGVKTGFTKAAGRCLVSAARQNGMILICVTLNAPSDWSDHTNLYNHLFDTYQMQEFLHTETILGEIPVSGSDILTLPFAAAESFSYPLCKGETLTTKFTLQESIAAPVQAGMHCGQLEINLGTTTVKTLPLIVKGDAQKQWIPEAIKRGFRLNLGSLYWSWLTLLHF